MPSAPATRRRQLLAWMLALLAASATALEAVTGATLLVVTGNIQVRNAADGAQFDMAMLEGLPRHSYVTRTPWYPEPRRFSGVLLRDLLAAVGAQGKTIRAVALNDYRVDIPMDDANRHDVMVAYLMDDKPMPVRDKGPLVIMYPFSANAEVRTAVHYGRAAWQLKQLEVR